MRGFAAIGLLQPKTVENVGSALRACHCYEASLMAVQGKRYHRASTDTLKSWRHIPMIETDDLRSVIPYGCVPVAVDLVSQAVNIADYKHPERAFYIFGPEDGTLGHDTLEWCRDVIYVPTTHCMNLAATVNVILFDRMMKAIRAGEAGA